MSALPSRASTRLSGEPPAEYAGHCPRCGRTHRLPNDVQAARAALDALFEALDASPVRRALETSAGKMIGVLVALDRAGGRHTLRAFSGELEGRTDWPGWAPAVLRREDTAALEAVTLERISALERELALCDPETARLRYRALLTEVTALASARRREARLRRQALSRSGATREEVEALALALKQADDAESAREQSLVGAARDAFESEREKARRLREERWKASLALSDAMFAAAKLTNARGERLPLREVFAGKSIAGGTGSCAVPKLLEAANVAGLRPVALAEAWWGPDLGTRRHGRIEPPCEKKCQPILGHLLCGLD